MKHSHPMKPVKTYVCRKCNESDFRSLMEFTKHLRKCTGVVVTKPSTVAKVIPPALPMKNGMKAELLRLRSLGVEVRDLADKLLKSAK